MATTNHTRTVNTHKAFSDIERDIRDYYAAHNLHTRDTELTALKIASRALAIAAAHVEPVNVEPVRQARETARQLLLNRLRELDRSGVTDWCCTCGVVSGAADARCVSCNRRRL